MSTYTPSGAATRSGFSLDTLRYYERIGLLSGVVRSSSGHRVFTDGDLEWLGVLRCLRDTGMPISDMQRYAELARDGEQTLTERLNLLREHAKAVEEHLALLADQYRHLQAKIGWYEGQLP
ncbi:MerR family transcriptional regulator [Hamadaea tsunoensis]|uniref:MerR family transcriptional regulator n=1 Tax=Hamadaea tsunoensis TaxID=53368 RepID=UPI0003F8DB65|nr:MerR family transcriptional regulator [Hamadaea tsunoensis]